VIIFDILTTLSLDNLWTLLGENCCWSLLGLKGLSDIYKDSSIALQCKGFALVYLPEATDDQSWIKLNAGQTGFYRVNYDENNWRKLADQLNTDHKVNNISCPRYLNRELKQPPRRRQWQRQRQRQRNRQKSNRFNKQSNSARASLFSVHFFAVTARLRRETLLCRGKTSL